MARKITRIERLSQKEEGKVVKRIVYLSILSVILTIFLMTLGVPLLGKFADFLNVVFRKNEVSQVSSESILAPRLDSLPHQTNSPSLTISGFSQDEMTVAVFDNMQKVGETQVENGKFQFENLSLSEGENEISVKAISKSGEESDFSASIKVILDKTPPKLDIENPFDGQSFSKDNRIRVTGHTDKDAQIYANGFLASVNGEGNFEVFVPVSEGESSIEIKAIDEAGNTQVETRKVNFRK